MFISLITFFLHSSCITSYIVLIKRERFFSFCSQLFDCEKITLACMHTTCTYEFIRDVLLLLMLFTAYSDEFNSLLVCKFLCNIFFASTFFVREIQHYSSRQLEVNHIIVIQKVAIIRGLSNAKCISNIQN